MGNEQGHITTYIIGETIHELGTIPFTLSLVSRPHFILGGKNYDGYTLDSLSLLSFPTQDPYIYYQNNLPEA